MKVHQIVLILLLSLLSQSVLAIDYGVLSFNFPKNIGDEEQILFKQKVFEHYQKLKDQHFIKIKDFHEFPITVTIDVNILSDGAAHIDEKGTYLLKLSPHVINSPLLNRLLTHEFLHLVHYKINPKELSWVKEGLASYFEFLVHGQGHMGAVNAAFETSTTPLQGTYTGHKDNLEQYGHNYLFFKYLIENCQDSLSFYDLLLSPKQGQSGLEALLDASNSKNSMCLSFDSIIDHFMRARVLNTLTNYGRDDRYLLHNIKTELPINEHLYTALKGKPNEYLNHFLRALPRYLPLILPLESSSIIDRMLEHNGHQIVVYRIKRSFPAYFERYFQGNKSQKVFELFLVYKK